MKKIHFLLIRKCILAAFMALSVMYNLSFAQEKIVGLFYLDEKPVSIVIKDGKIAEVNRIAQLPASGRNIYIAPGLIDNQVNGFNGVSFAFGEGELSEEALIKATRALWERGVTTYLPTLTSNSHQLLLRNFAILGEASNNESLLGSVPGFHLEGPYISPIDGFRGAHSANYIRKPDWNEFMEYYIASGEKILTLTVAPEIEGAMEFIKQCSELGIVVALGHHNGFTEIINRAVEAGARISTHLGNAMSNTINRHVNPLWPQLSNDDLMISIICDGFHLLPEQIRTFYKVKGPGKTIITSDVTMYANLKPGIYKNIDGEDIELTLDGRIQYLAQQNLAGSASTLDKGVGHIMKVTGCSLADAIRMASTNPAQLYNLDDRGVIEEGKRADLILFTVENFRIKILKTIVNGQVVYQSSE
ncbi:MAG: N-acetylglucosamine-6-phosphate deacetylase [Melioribacteraceae bacterium]|nr:N-acetylglucosamine-6-phosphate deacetylase [Melioribacteraceae bacterium]